MFRIERYLPLVVVTAALLFVEAGCGGGSGSGGTSPTGNNVSPAQAQAISEQVQTTVLLGLDSAFATSSAARRTLSAAVSQIHPDQSSGCTSTNGGETCNWPVSYSGSCPEGGTMSVAGAIDGDLNSSGDGSISSTLAITPTNCAVSSLTINGDPSISIAMQIPFADQTVTYPANLTETGGVSYGPNPSGTCQVNVSISVTSSTTCTITGSVCGQSVNGSC